MARNFKRTRGSYGSANLKLPLQLCKKACQSNAGVGKLFSLRAGFRYPKTSIMKVKIYKLSFALMTP